MYYILPIMLGTPRFHLKGPCGIKSSKLSAFRIWCLPCNFHKSKWTKKFGVVCHLNQTFDHCIAGNWGRDKLPPFRSQHFQMHVLEWNVWNELTISLKFVSKVQNNNIPALVQIRAWCRSGDKPLSDSMMIWFTDVVSEHADSKSVALS